MPIVILKVDYGADIMFLSTTPTFIFMGIQDHIVSDNMSV